ncbi:MAG: exodeoxyribonuclease VII large subunit [Verrucomicrobiota bacterium]
MSKTSSQWDFSGELFPQEAMRQVFSVTELTGQIRRLLEKQVGRVWVSGEITNLRAQSSGHFYFTLKDANAQLNCVLFRGDCLAQREFLQDGRKVLLQGEMTVYEPRGQYQLRVVEVEVQGVGALQIAFEKLKQKLNADGWFAPERKRSLPRYPEAIGLITSPTGAAIRDVLHVVQRRHSALKIILLPCRVQGNGAAQEIASAIQALNDFTSVKLDLILLTRGGGSLEDLWAFNEEILARAIFESRLPVVSAVGHEIDFTISDFVADMRAATPSAAAEIITEGFFASRKFIAEIENWMRVRFQQNCRRKTNSLRDFSGRLVRLHPKRKIQEQFQWLDDLEISLLRCVKHDVRKQKELFQTLRRQLWRWRPRQLWQRQKENFLLTRQQFLDQTHRVRRKFHDRLAHLETRLRLLSPEHVLARGYSITTDDSSGKVLRDAGKIRDGQLLKTRLADGEVESIAQKPR